MDSGQPDDRKYFQFQLSEIVLEKKMLYFFSLSYEKNFFVLAIFLA